MKIGYPCINRTIKCRGAKTFRLKSYSKQKLEQVVANNLDCLCRILEYNLNHDILFFRISSQVVPFASHPICTFSWQKRFKAELREMGKFIKEHRMRISMHPDQFIVLNSPNEQVVKRSIAELDYHAQVLDLMGLDHTAKIQLHAGGVYGDKEFALQRFSRNYSLLNKRIKNRLVVENDDKSYTVCDCLKLHRLTGLPVLLDVFHDRVNPCGLSLSAVFASASATWKKKDGLLMVDFSTQEKGRPRGAHAQTIDLKQFRALLRQSANFDFDLMLEIKDKENSALKAVALAADDPRFRRREKIVSLEEKIKKG